MRQKWLRHLCLLAVLAMLVAACGGGGGGPEEETEATEATESDTAAEEDTASEEDTAAAEGDGVLTIGTLLPETGSLAFLGPPMYAGVDLAAQEVNEAGGVLGQDVVIVDSDSGDTSTDIASQSVDRLLSENVDAIIGAASSGVSLTVIDAITGAGVVMFSPANTAPDFTDYDDGGLYFRNAPSDVLQGSVLAEVMVEDGCTTLGIMALQDPYGEGLAGFLSESFEASGGTLAGEPIVYDPQAPNFDAEVQQIASQGPDCVAVIGFDESARVITSMIAAGIGPGSDTGVYGVDGNMGNALGEQLGEAPGALAGMKGTTPLTELSEEFRNRILEVDPNVIDFNYSAESYDATVIIALAAEVAGTDAPEALAEQIIAITNGSEECTSFAECRDIIAAGGEPDYQGAAGPIDMSDVGDPTVASFGILTFGEDNQIDPSAIEYRFAETSS